MPLLNHGRLSAFVAFAACLILLLASNILTKRDVSVNTQAAYPNRAAAPAALARREIEAPATLVPVPFGNQEGLQLSSPKEESLLPSSLVKRDDVTITWFGAIQDGHAQLDRLENGARTDSPATAVFDMVGPADAPEGHGYGWVVHDVGDVLPVPAGYEPVYEDLQISQGADNVFRYASQELPYSNCLGDNIKPTDGRFRNMINIHSGTMVALTSFSPANRIDKSDPDWKMKLPRVSKMSDVLWIQWVTVAQEVGTPEKTGGLEYIFRYDVATGDTKWVIEQAAAKHEGGPIGDSEFVAKWPGYEFTINDEQFVALLGTVHGRSIVDLIMTHATGLPGKSIESVTIFTTKRDDDDDEEGDSYHMLWTLTT